MFAQTKVLCAHAVLWIPSEALIDPFLVPFFIRSRHDEKLDFHLFEFAGAERKVPGRDLVTKRLADLRDAEGQLEAHGLQDVVKVHENALSGLGPEVSYGGIVLDRPHEGFEHEVELPWLGELPPAARRTERSLRSAVPAWLATRDNELVSFGRLAVMHPLIIIEL